MYRLIYIYIDIYNVNKDSKQIKIKKDRQNLLR